jgi:rapamycin-insensitive companion of mTOR
MYTLYRPGLDVQSLLSAFTDLDWPAGVERLHRWYASKGAVVALMRSWTGVILLTSDPR